MISEQAIIDDNRAKLLGSLLIFTQYFYKQRTGRDFELTYPDCRESHFKIISRALTRVFRGDCKRLIINVPPRYGKTEMIINFIAWAIAHYSDSNFLYISYSATLAKKQTQTVRQIIQMPEYGALFNVYLSKNTTAKDNFELSGGGSVYAAGAKGTITGRGAGILSSKRFGGCVIIDDIHKPEEVLSDTMRNNVKDWYLNTLKSRVNDTATPIIFIGQIVHEDDLPNNLKKGYDGDEWEVLKIQALDECENALSPERHTKEQLLKMKDTMPYVFASQYQQEAIPAGGALFKPQWFKRIETLPEFTNFFITMDSAETEDLTNDATALSLWGAYNITDFGENVGLKGLVWLDCLETWVDPVDLEPLFNDFYTRALRRGWKPEIALIEKKSTGTYLCSLLKDRPGIRIIAVERSVASGSKAWRFIQCQPYVAQKYISLPAHAQHTQTVIDHCTKITANDTHLRDDIADTMADAIHFVYIQRFFDSQLPSAHEEKVVKRLAEQHAQLQQLNQQRSRTTGWRM